MRLVGTRSASRGADRPRRLFHRQNRAMLKATNKARLKIIPPIMRAGIAVLLTSVDTGDARVVVSGGSPARTLVGEHRSLSLKSPSARAGKAIGRMAPVGCVPSPPVVAGDKPGVGGLPTTRHSAIGRQAGAVTGEVTLLGGAVATDATRTARMNRRL